MGWVVQLRPPFHDLSAEQLRLTMFCTGRYL